MSFGEKIAAYRNRAGLTQEELAMSVGIHRHHLSDIERGRYGPPKTATVVLMVRVLQLTLEEADDLLEEVIRQAREKIRQAYEQSGDES